MLFAGVRQQGGSFVSNVRALSSVVEHRLDVTRVVGSIPTARTWYNIRMQLDIRRRQPVAAFWYTALLPLLLSVFVLILGLFFSAVFFFGPGSSCDSTCVSLLSSVALFVLIVAGVAFAYPLLYYLLFTYEVHERSITVNSGILFRQYETIDFKKIQTIDNERGPLLMLFGLTIVEIWTASWDQLSHSGVNGARVRPRPDMYLILEKNAASELRDFIMRAKG